MKINNEKRLLSQLKEASSGIYDKIRIPTKPEKYYYQTLIDTWTGFMTVEEFLMVHNSASDPVNENVWPIRCGDIKTLIKDISEAVCYLSQHSCFGGDIREIYISGLPGEDGMLDTDIMLAIKAETNGTTFIVSPYELVWLNNCRIHKKIKKEAA